MSKNICRALAFAGAMSLAVGTASADEAMSPWSGFYGGVHAGFSHGGDASVTGFAGDLSLDASFPNGTSFLGGGQLGYNFQNDRLVFGLEADFSGASVSSDPGAIIDIGIIEIGTFTSSVDWFGTVRGRVGVLLDNNILFYGTGGLAYGEVSNSIGYAIGRCPGRLCLSDSVSSSEVRVGWTAGAGVESVLNDSMRVKLEYLYVDLGSGVFFQDTIPVPIIGGIDIGASSSVNFHVARVGLNIDFDMPIPGQ
jgi:outer membrane immunogenic protein